MLSTVAVLLENLPSTLVTSKQGRFFTPPFYAQLPEAIGHRQNRFHY